MGYELVITRRADPSDVGAVISVGEWRAAVEGAADLEFTDSAVARTTDGATVEFWSEHLAVWNGHPSRVPVWFLYKNGEISVKNPDEACIERMRCIALSLGASVVGDDGEVYDEAGESSAPKVSGRSFFRVLSDAVAGLLKLSRAKGYDAPFKVGDVVRDSWGDEHDVVRVETGRHHTFGGLVHYRRRGDGHETSSFFVAHGKEKIPAGGSGRPD